MNKELTREMIKYLNGDVKRINHMLKVRAFSELIADGEKTDGKELPALIQKSREAGMEIETVIGDKAYSSKENIDAAKDGDYELVSRLNSIVTQGNRTKPDEFEFNKDARSRGHIFWNPDNIRSWFPATCGHW